MKALSDVLSSYTQTQCEISSPELQKHKLLARYPKKAFSGVTLKPELLLLTPVGKARFSCTKKVISSILFERDNFRTLIFSGDVLDLYLNLYRLRTCKEESYALRSVHAIPYGVVEKNHIWKWSPTYQYYILSSRDVIRYVLNKNQSILLEDWLISLWAYVEKQGASPFL